MQALDIAVCGINCSLCYAFQRSKNHCPGCNSDAAKPTYCSTCRIRNCTTRDQHDQTACLTCASFPCVVFHRLYKRYHTKYGVDVVANLQMIQENGMAAFLAAEQQKWTCSNCQHILCMHKDSCANCGEKNPYYRIV